MPIQTLIALTFIAFLCLWLADLFFTSRVTKILGKGVEVNPMLSFIIGIRGRFLPLFKIVEISIFSFLLWQVVLLNEKMAFSILLAIIFVYSLAVLAGLKIYIDTIQNSAPVVMLFLLMMILIMVFIYLSYIEYQNKVSIYNALSECSSRYSELYYEYSSKTSNSSNFSSSLEFDFNLTIERWTP